MNEAFTQEEYERAHQDLSKIQREIAWQIHLLQCLNASGAARSRDLSVAITDLQTGWLWLRWAIENNLDEPTV